MELVVITPPDYFEGEAEQINEIFAAGLNLLHLRKPENNVAKFRMLMKEIKPAYYPAISIHQHHELSEEFGLKRLHFKAARRMLVENTRLQELRGKGFALSTSIHGLNELEGLYGFDFVFFGPVFNSISKTGYKSILTADFVLPPHQVKIFALGGVNADLIAQLEEINFDGVAVLGSIWQQKEPPLTAFKTIRKAINELQ